MNLEKIFKDNRTPDEITDDTLFQRSEVRRYREAMSYICHKYKELLAICCSDLFSYNQQTKKQKHQMVHEQKKLLKSIIHVRTIEMIILELLEDL